MTLFRTRSFECGLHLRMAHVGPRAGLNFGSSILEMVRMMLPWVNRVACHGGRPGTQPNSESEPIPNCTRELLASARHWVFMEAEAYDTALARRLKPDVPQWQFMSHLSVLQAWMSWHWYLNTVDGSGPRKLLVLQGTQNFVTGVEAFDNVVAYKKGAAERK